MVKRVYGLGLRQNIPVKGFPRAAVKRVFGKDGATTKHQIATVIAGRLATIASSLSWRKSVIPRRGVPRDTSASSAAAPGSISISKWAAARPMITASSRGP